MDALTQFVPLAEKLPGLLMVIFRVGGLMILAPFFGSAMIPAKVKIALTLTLGLAVWPIVPIRSLPPIDLAAIVIAVAGELLVGLVIGLAIAAIFAGLQLVGTVIGQQMGVSLAGVFDPTFQENTDVLSVLYYWVGLIIFLAIGGHRLLIGGLLDSFKAVPIGAFAVTEKWLGLLVGLLDGSFVMAVKMSAPAVVALFLASVAMGLIARTVPQLNILTVGFALRTSLGMAVAAVTLLAVFKVFGGTIEESLKALGKALVVGG